MRTIPDDALLHSMDLLPLDDLLQARAVNKDWARLGRSVVRSASWRAQPQNLAALQAAEWLRGPASASRTRLSASASLTRHVAVAADGERVAAVHWYSGLTTLHVWQLGDPMSSCSAASSFRSMEPGCADPVDSAQACARVALNGDLIAVGLERGLLGIWAILVTTGPPATLELLPLVTLQAHPPTSCVRHVAFAGGSALYSSGSERALCVSEPTDQSAPDSLHGARQWTLAPNGMQERAHLRRITGLAAVPGEAGVVVTSGMDSCLKVWVRPPYSDEPIHCTQTGARPPPRFHRPPLPVPLCAHAPAPYRAPCRCSLPPMRAVRLGTSILGLALDSARVAVCHAGSSEIYWFGLHRHPPLGEACRGLPDTARYPTWRLIDVPGHGSRRLGGRLSTGVDDARVAFCGEGLLVVSGGKVIPAGAGAPRAGVPAWPGRGGACELKRAARVFNLGGGSAVQLARWDHVAAVCAVAASSGVIAIGTEDGLVHAIALRKECRPASSW